MCLIRRNKQITIQNSKFNNNNSQSTILLIHGNDIFYFYNSFMENNI